MVGSTSRFVWHQYFAEELALAKSFYAALFGWRYRTLRYEGFDYVMIRSGNIEFGGMALLEDQPTAEGSYWCPVASSEDVDEDADRAEALGATVAIRPADVPDVGCLSLLRDADGSRFMLLSEELPGQATRHNEPGLFYWDELATHDAKQAVKLYGRLMNWIVSSHDVGRHGTYFLFRDRQAKQKDVAGMHAIPTSQEPLWRSYVRVNSVNEAAKLTEMLDGAVEVEPTRIPEIGKFAHLIDSQGARFSVIEVGERT